MQSSMDDAIIRTIIGVQEFKTYFNIMIHFIIYIVREKYVIEKYQFI